MTPPPQVQNAAVLLERATEILGVKKFPKKISFPCIGKFSGQNFFTFLSQYCIYSALVKEFIIDFR
jgi:hypothetical protein